MRGLREKTKYYMNEKNMQWLGNYSSRGILLGLDWSIQSDWVDVLKGPLQLR